MSRDLALKSPASARQTARSLLSVRVSRTQAHLRLLQARKAGGRAFFGTISQTQIEYRDSPLSAGRLGALHGGDRLPYVEWTGGDNHVSLSTLDWQVHVYGKGSASLKQALAHRGIELVTLSWNSAAKRVGLKRNAAYLIRPDGHIATMSPRSPAKIVAYLDSLAIGSRAVSHRSPQIPRSSPDQSDVHHRTRDCVP